MTRFILRLRSQRWRMSRMNSSLLSLLIGKFSAKPTISRVSAPISNPPGARVSSRAVPSSMSEDSMVNFWASFQQGLSFLMVDWITPVESRINRNMSAFPSRLRYTQPRTVTFWSLQLPSSIWLIFTSAMCINCLLIYSSSSLNAYRYCACLMRTSKLVF